jgi:hypothetical protein
VSAQGQALEASQAKAVAALGKAYVRREEQPDDELFAGLLHKIGLDDDVAISFLLAAWSVLREEKAAPPGEQAPAQTVTKPASDAQWSLIRRLADEKGTTAPSGPLTQALAHNVIDQLKAGTYKADDYEVPF